MAPIKYTITDINTDVSQDSNSLVLIFKAIAANNAAQYAMLGLAVPAAIFAVWQIIRCGYAIWQQYHYFNLFELATIRTATTLTGQQHDSSGNSPVSNTTGESNATLAASVSVRGTTNSDSDSTDDVTLVTPGSTSLEDVNTDSTLVTTSSSTAANG